MNNDTDITITYRGIQLVRRTKTGPKGGRVYLYQAAGASRD